MITLWRNGMKVLVIQLCPTLCNSMDCSSPGSSDHGILQARILEWVSIPFSGDLSNTEIKPGSPALQADSLPTEPLGSAEGWWASVLLHLGWGERERLRQVFQSRAFKSLSGIAGILSSLQKSDYTPCIQGGCLTQIFELCL